MGEKTFGAIQANLGAIHIAISLDLILTVIVRCWRKKSGNTLKKAETMLSASLTPDELIVLRKGSCRSVCIRSIAMALTAAGPSVDAS